MKRVKSLVFHSISFPAPDSFKNHFIDIISDFGFNEQIGYGLSFIETSTDALTVKAIKRTASFINDFDINQNQFSRRQINVYSDFIFSIDFELGILCVLGGITQLNYVKYLFRTIISEDYELAPVDLSISAFYKILAQKQINAKIDHITINHFNYKNELVGRFAGTVLNYSIASELIESYKSDIVKLSFLIKINERESFTLQIFPNGVLKFLSEEENYDLILDFIKQIIFTKNG
ncbi:hypothetical protein [Mucilaginibacter terrae]|uniref:Uncharacterized protein n=1 Tax=Mucilaginibacter terrae TaxID=1955052 RepID=A0ABU3GN63_9SPHI|nr:hypothetical protein [Mucilaginibacter terrae]MDT3401222.1 hypothetical protein [Mucilaginibacter terrae]